MMVSKTTVRTGNIETESLEAHVELCAHRYAVLEKRITSAEVKINELSRSSDTSRTLIVKSISAAAAVVSLVISLTIIVLDKLH